MTEPALTALPDRWTLRRAIRHELRRLDPSIRVVAEELLTETTSVDLVGRGARGELVAIRIGRGGDDEALLTRLLADRTWLTPRLVDWCKLAPELDLDPDAGVRGLLVCPDFRRETYSAATLLPEQAIGLVRYHCLPRQHGRWAVLLESVKLAPPIHRPSLDAICERDPLPDPAEDRSAPPAGTGSRPQPRLPCSSPPSDGSHRRPSAFRTGLTDTDLRPSSDPLIRAG